MSTNPAPIEISKYELEAWLPRFGAAPKKVIECVDVSECYEMEKFWVVELESKQYATVHESGCSCYGHEDAQIDLHRTKRDAMKSFNAWKSQQRINGRTFP